MDMLTMQLAQSRHSEMLREAEQRRRANQIVRTNRANRAERVNRAERSLFHFDLGKLHVNVTFDAPRPVTQM